MDLAEIQKQVDAWLENIKQDMYAQQTVEVVQCQLLLIIIDKLISIDESLSSMSSDSWDDHHNK